MMEVGVIVGWVMFNLGLVVLMMCEVVLLIM